MKNLFLILCICLFNEVFPDTLNQSYTCIRNSISRFIIHEHGRLYFDTSDIYFESSIYLDSNENIFLNYKQFGEDSIDVKRYISFISTTDSIRGHLKVIRNNRKVKYRSSNQIIIDISYMNDKAAMIRKNGCHPNFTE